MKLRSVALVGVVCIATLGLIGVGAHAAFTTSTTSGQTITAGTWATQPTKSITRRTITTTDPTAPTASITYPVDGTSYGTAWTGTITGTASSAASTTITAAAMVAIEDTTTNKWWNGSSFNDATQSFVAAIGNTTWLLSLGAGSLTSGDSYSVVAQVTDSAGDVGTSSTVSFTYNTGPTAAPTVSVTYPVDGTTYGADWTGTITGTASSGASTTITAAAMVAIEDTTTNQWWNGTAFAASSQSFVAANGNTTWYLAFGAGNLTAGNSYSVVAEVTDSAENVGTSSTVSFTCGTAAMIDPTVGVTYPVDGTSYGADWTGTILGTASSGASTTITATAMVAIEDTTTNQWWNGSSFNDATQSFVAAIGNTTWYLAFGAGNLTAGNNYSVVAEVTDSASNVGTSSTVSFTYGTAQAPGASNG
jgi:ribosomal protein S4